jgi:putative Mg2+ transporter-C (MgtC) family protein
MDFTGFDWNSVFSNFIIVAIAYALALPVAWDRETHARGVGLRTFPLVAVASCGYILLATTILEGSPEAQSRVTQGLMTGIGFIGGGAILKGGGSVYGTATAASVWNTGAIGAAVAYGRYDIGLILSALNFLTLRLLTPLKEREEEDKKEERAKEEKADREQGR